MKKKWIVNPLIAAIVILVVIAFTKVTSTLFTQDPASVLQEAYKSYQVGEKAASPAEREAAFNHALELYAQLEETYHPTRGNGKLYYNIANTFYQLEAYPWTILNAYRAQALRPRDQKVQVNLNSALKKLNLPQDETTAFQSVFFFHFKLSLPERIQLFSAVTLLALVAFSLYLWTTHGYWRAIGTVLSIVAGVMLFSLAYTNYLAPIEGVLVRSTLVYRDAGTQYAPVTEDPSPSGLKVKVLDAADNGKWLKVQTPAGTVGFIPSENMRLI